MYPEVKSALSDVIAQCLETLRIRWIEGFLSADGQVVKWQRMDVSAETSRIPQKNVHALLCRFKNIWRRSAAHFSIG